MRQFQVAVTEAPVAGRLPRSAAGATWSPRRGASTATRSRDEYDALFRGVGKPEVFLFGSYYLSGFLNEKPLVALRTDLRALGLARDERRERDRRPHRLPVRGDALPDRRR